MSTPPTTPWDEHLELLPGQDVWTEPLSRNSSITWVNNEVLHRATQVIVVDDVRAIEAHAQNGALASHQVIDGGHDGSVRIIVRRHPRRVFRDTAKTLILAS